MPTSKQNDRIWILAFILIWCAVFWMIDYMW